MFSISKCTVFSVILMMNGAVQGTVLQQTTRPGRIHLINENGFPIIGSFLADINPQDVPLFQKRKNLSDLEEKLQRQIKKDQQNFLNKKKSSENEMRDSIDGQEGQTVIENPSDVPVHHPTNVNVGGTSISLDPKRSSIIKRVRQLQTETPTLPSHQTLRRISPGLEQLIGHVFPVLDHGSITVIDYMGTDEAIALAAWISTGRSQYTQDDIRRLIANMMKNGHTSPFEMAVIQLRVVLPIFIARQWFRHRMASYNEKSARYSELGNAFYIPDINRLRQGLTPAARELGDQKLTEKIQELMNYESQKAYKQYDNLMHELFLNRELARTLLPVNVYTEFYWRIDLHNLFHFLELRTSPHAQYEIQQYANIILHQIVRPWVPAAYDAFMKYRYNAAMVPAKYMRLCQICLKEGKIINQEESGLSDEEYKEFLKFFKINGKVA